MSLSLSLSLSPYWTWPSWLMTEFPNPFSVRDPHDRKTYSMRKLEQCRTFFLSGFDRGSSILGDWCQTTAWSHQAEALVREFAMQYWVLWGQKLSGWPRSKRPNLRLTGTTMTWQWLDNDLTMTWEWLDNDHNFLSRLHAVHVNIVVFKT